jgi:iduronate 2-sulfatase
MGYSVRTAAGRYSEWRDWQTGKVLGAEYYDHTRSASTREGANRLEPAKETVDLKAARRALHAQFPPGVPPAKR